MPEYMGHPDRCSCNACLQVRVNKLENEMAYLKERDKNMAAIIMDEIAKSIQRAVRQ